MLSEIHKDQYVQILKQIESERSKIFTTQEIADYLNVSRTKLSQFLNFKIYDVELLMRYAAFHGYVFEFSIREKTSIVDGAF